jgi:hypothetical protein
VEGMLLVSVLWAVGIFGQLARERPFNFLMMFEMNIVSDLRLNLNRKLTRSTQMNNQRQEDQGRQAR